MTALDDALNTSAPQYGPVRVYADWKEQPLNYDLDPSPDTLRDLTNQVGPGGVTVEHSLDDGLPDPVTMTSSNDAAGAMTSDLVGRGEQYADFISFRTNRSNTSTTATPPFLFPVDIGFGDLCIITLSVNSTSVVVTPVVDADGNMVDGWKLEGRFDDGPDIATYVYSNYYAIGISPPQVTLSVATSITWLSMAFWATTASGDVHVDWRVNEVVGSAETVSGTSHTTLPVTLTRRGVILSIWTILSTAGNITAPAGYTKLLDRVGTPLESSAIVTTNRRYPGEHTSSMTTVGATAVATMINIGIEVWDRPAMDALQLFSPFNEDSPFYGWERDTADVHTDFEVLTEDGMEPTTIFTGQMSDISVNGRTAEMSANSKTRITLNRSLELPLVWANRENCTIEWFATWLMARGGQFAGPAPMPTAIHWAPMYGSTHDHLGDDLDYAGQFLTNAATALTGKKPPTTIEGPFVSAIYCEQTATQTLEQFMTFRPTKELLPHIADQYPNGLFWDQMSQQNAAGRFTCWVRADPVQAAPAGYVLARDYIFQYSLGAFNEAGTLIGGVECGIRSATRYPWIMLKGSAGNTFVEFSGIPLPTDGQWHFIGFSWDWKLGNVRGRLDGAGQIGSAFPTTDADLFTSDAGYWFGGESSRIFNQYRFHVPVSDVQVEAGPTLNTDPWTDFFPQATAPGSFTATIRPTFQTIEMLAETTPVNGWDTLAEVARASLSHYRVNELDNMEFLPPRYFGESAQFISTMTADTEVNTSELAVRTDSSKTRNVVTVIYDQTLADANRSPVFQLTAATEIPRGTSYIVFDLELPAAEIHGMSNPQPTWTFTNLTAAHIATPSTIPVGDHRMTVNRASDGSSTVIATGFNGVTARIMTANSSQATVRFINKTSTTAWLMNNGQDVPFLTILGYAVRTIKGYVTVRDDRSVRGRRERALDVEIPWVQNRVTATNIAQQLVTMLARPRSEIAVKVIGDPRRTPGQLITLADSQGTRAEGTWRILSLTDNINGPEFTQDLSLVYVLPPGIWDGPDGWDYALWGE